MNKKIALITRTFQPKKDIKNFDLEYLKKNFIIPLKKIRNNKVFSKTYIVINTDYKSQYSEILSDGLSPSKFHINNIFNEEIKSGEIVVIELNDWGNNAGSANALTTGLLQANKDSMEYIMNWSSEMDLLSTDIENGLKFLIDNKLYALGFLRKGWWKKFQWLMIQNTASIWNVKKLMEVNGFSTYCDNNKTTVFSQKYGEISLQGMEDFYSILLLNKKFDDFKWGMIGLRNNIDWNIETDKNKENGLRNLKKIYRQELVMNHYINYLEPEKNIEEVLNQIFSKIKILQ